MHALPRECNIDYQEYHILMSGLVWTLKIIGVQASTVEKSAYKVLQTNALAAIVLRYQHCTLRSLILNFKTTSQDQWL